MSSSFRYSATPSSAPASGHWAPATMTLESPRPVAPRTLAISTGGDAGSGAGSPALRPHSPYRPAPTRMPATPPVRSPIGAGFAAAVAASPSALWESISGGGSSPRNSVSSSSASASGARGSASPLSPHHQSPGVYHHHGSDDDDDDGGGGGEDWDALEGGGARRGGYCSAITGKPTRLRRRALPWYRDGCFLSKVVIFVVVFLWILVVMGLVLTYRPPALSVASEVGDVVPDVEAAMATGSDGHLASNLAADPARSAHPEIAEALEKRGRRLRKRAAARGSVTRP